MEDYCDKHISLFVYIIVLLVTIEMGIKCPKTNSVSHISKVRKKIISRPPAAAPAARSGS